MLIRLIALAVVCLILHGVVPKFIITNPNSDVALRFLEHRSYIPSLKTPNNEGTLTHQTLRAWLSDPQTADQQRAYVTPVIIPVDLLYLLAVGLLLGSLSSFLASRVPLLEKYPVWLWWLFPMAYMGFDFVEDMMIVAMFTRHEFLEGMYGILRTVTHIKIAAVLLALFQVVALVFVWLFSRFGLLQRWAAR